MGNKKGGPGKLSAEKVQQLNICLTAQKKKHTHTTHMAATFWPQLIWRVWLSACPASGCHLLPRHKMGARSRQFKLKNYMHFRCRVQSPARVLGSSLRRRRHCHCHSRLTNGASEKLIAIYLTLLLPFSRVVFPTFKCIFYVCTSIIADTVRSRVKGADSVLAVKSLKIICN